MNDLIYRLDCATELSALDSEPARIPSQLTIRVKDAAEMIVAGNQFLDSHVEKIRGLLTVMENHYIIDFSLRIKLVGFGSLSEISPEKEVIEAQ